MLNTVGGAVRKAASGTGDSPDDKKAKTDEPDEVKADLFEEAMEDLEGDDEDIKSMMKRMMALLHLPQKAKDSPAERKLK